MKKILAGALIVVVSLFILSAPNVLAQLPCTADFNCDQDVDGGDVEEFLNQFGRSQYSDPCPESPCPISCEGTLSPQGRWCDQENGTVKDMTTGLVWLKNAGWCGDRPWDVDVGSPVYDAHEVTSFIVSGGSWAPPDLIDGSGEGDWRLPTLRELVEIVNGTEYISENQMYFFVGVQPSHYWTSTSAGVWPGNAYTVHMVSGPVFGVDKSEEAYVWPVRGDID